MASRARSASVDRGMGSLICTRPNGLERVTLRTVLVMNSEFGTITVERSLIWISVARTLMRRMSPSTPPSETQSPTWTGRSASRIRPDTKFCTMACRPKPIPTDKALAIQATRSSPMPAADRASATATTKPAYPNSVTADSCMPGSSSVVGR